MDEETFEKVTEYIETGLAKLHEKRLKKLKSLKLELILERKNPYLFKTKHLTTATEFVNAVLDAFLSSQEETDFGGFLERLAVFICGNIYGGRKAGIKGLDLEFERDGTRYIVSIKSGPNWGNSGQIDHLVQKFKTAIRTLRTNAERTEIIAVNGCMYGRELPEERDGYLKLCGQRFWELISGDENLYLELIEPLGIRAKERKEEFQEELSKLKNRFAKKFLDEFCKPAGEIDWERLVKYNAAIVPPA